MTEYELISKQQLEIEDLKLKLTVASKDKDKLRIILFGIGAPLNDNSREFNKNQLVVFTRIASIFNL